MRGFSNSTEGELRRVERYGLPSRGLDLTMQMGLARPPLAARTSVDCLPNSVLFRLVPLLSWVERFYAATPGPAAEGT